MNWNQSETGNDMCAEPVLGELLKLRNLYKIRLLPSFITVSLLELQVGFVKTVWLFHHE